MELWEAMKELGENPNKVFKNRYGVKLTAKNGWASIDGRTTFPMEDVWEEVKQPVTWQEAIQAWAEGNTVIVENTCDKRKYDGKKNFLKDEYGNPMGSWEITNGTWYIED